MSASAVHSAPAASSDDGKFHLFVQVAMILAVITGVEIILIYLPFPTWLIVGSLVLLSLVKFLMVIFWFMHLKFDKVFCTILFFIGLVLAGGTVAALMAVFSTKDSVPLTAQAIYVERAAAAE